jgi:CHAT domain-containing protein/tetratricopeptide (TPR) repeat protein
MPATNISKVQRGFLGLLWLICVCVTQPSQELQSPQPKSRLRQSETRDQSLPTRTSQKDNEARQAMARADELRANWTETSLREAIEQYDEAALTWISALDFGNATHSTLKSGDLCFLLNEYAQAVKRYEKAEALADKTGDWPAKATAMARIGRLQSVLGNNDLAEKHLTKALDLSKQHEADRSINATNAYGEILSNLAEVSYAKGNFVKARELLESALDVWHDNPAGEARAHLFNGYIAGGIGDLQKAFAELSEALKLYQQVRDKGGEGLALTALGLWHSHREEYSLAVELHQDAVEIFRAIGDRHSQAVALNAFGQRYQIVRQYSLAFDHYQQALHLLEDIGSVDGITATLFKLASIQGLRNKPDEALALYERCVRLSHDTRKVRSEVYALNEIATFYAFQGRHELALKQYQRVMKFYESIGDLRGQATALNAYGDVLLQTGQPRVALDAFRRALPLSDKVGNKDIRISTLRNLARANLALGFHETALSWIQQALDIIEDLRANVESPDFRVSYFSGERKHYELCIEILMQLERLRPGRGFVAEALLMSEKSRARLLLDLVSESRTAPRLGPAPELIERERELRKLFQLQAQYRLNLSLAGEDSDEIAAVDRQLDQLGADYQEVQAQLRQKYPRLFSVEQSAPLSLQQIQNELRDDGTILLEYAMGEERSYLWAVTFNSLQYYELPARKRIEDAARELYRLTTARQGSSEQVENYQAHVETADNAYLEKATNLSQMLLGPVAEQLGNRRMLVVTEGALQHISLDALPVPVRKTDGPDRWANVSGKFLIEQNEIVVLPSISTLIAIRNTRPRAHSPVKLVAIIADPVFRNNDDRVNSEEVSRGIAQAATGKQSHQSSASTAANQTRNGALARLPYASEEADAISSVAPWGTTLVAKGFDATRETAMGPDIGQYQIVHFATHGLLDSQRPELSGLVLSSVDRDGQEKNGLMPLYDIYSMDLSAELTVLSACQTALGKDLQGEGVVGLTHSFISAGSNSVVASLWKVDDRATAFLMADFYESMLQKGMSPAVALRSAKLKVMRDKRWSAPYYWAGFVLQGEYTNHIVVARHPWLRFGLVLLGSLILLASVLLVIKRRKRRFPPAQST